MSVQDILNILEQKTIYTINDEYGKKTTLTITKATADTLQSEMPNVHSYIQETYNKVAKKFPHLSRREKGNYVRDIADYKSFHYVFDAI